MKKDGRYTILYKHGTRMCVMRPKNPKLAVQLSKEAVEASKRAVARGETPREADFNDIIKKCGGSTLIGFYGRRGMLFAVVNEHGEKVDDVQPGDAFAAEVENEPVLH